MSKRDNVKARRRLKKPKKIYTNESMESAYKKIREPREFRPSIGHKGAQGVYLDKNGNIRVRKAEGKQLSVPLQKSNSPIESFNHGGLQHGNSPQRIHAAMKKMDSYLIANRISPDIRRQIMYNGEQYKSASGGFYRSKDPERKNYHREIIKGFEMNSYLLGLRGIELRNGVKTGYINNNVPHLTRQANYDYYEAGYNKMLDRAREKFDLAQENNTTIESIENNNDTQSGSAIEQEQEYNQELQESIDFILDETGDGVEYGFYNPDEVSNVIDAMNGGVNARSHYANDLERLCNSAGYTVDALQNHYISGDPLPAPNRNLLGDGINVGSKGANVNIGEIETNTKRTRRK